MKIAIVHDWLYGGGAEKVVQELHNIYPDAPIFTSYCTKEWREKLDGKVITGYLNRWPFTQLRKFLPLLRMWWFESLDFTEYDIVISSSGNGEARFVLSKEKLVGRKPNRPVHISYTHSPPHFYWRKYEQYLKNPGFKPEWLARLGLKVLVGYMRRKDYEAAQKVDYLVANSTHIQSDIQHYYKRDSSVIHPPVDTSLFAQVSRKSKVVSRKKLLGEPKLRFVTWGRLVPYKRFDIAVTACTKLGVSLEVIGDGHEMANLKSIAGPTINFRGRLSSEELEKAAHNADAFLFPSEEDFGIAPVEAMAAGLPVIAYKSGGAMDYVINGKTGLFFEEQSVDSLMGALKQFDANRFDQELIAAHAKTNFDNEVFRKKIREFVGRVAKDK